MSVIPAWSVTLAAPRQYRNESSRITVTLSGREMLWRFSHLSNDQSLTEVSPAGNSTERIRLLCGNQEGRLSMLPVPAIVRTPVRATSVHVRSLPHVPV